jgi:hypothetical protein
MFRHRLPVMTGEQVVRDGFAYCDLLLAQSGADRHDR